MEEQSAQIPHIFEIHDSEINVSEIMKEIESNLSKRNINKEELNKIYRADFSPDSPGGYREFDPAYIANQFESGISPPKFQNKSLWFIRGPIKWIIVKLIELYSYVEKKLSFNRIRAFYSVVHELIVLKKRYDLLQSRFDELEKEVKELKKALNHK